MKPASLLLLSLLFIGCGPEHYLIYEGKPSPDTYTFYSNGIPITSYSDNNEYLLFTTEEASLLGNTYLRVWLLVQNNSDISYLLEPYNIAEIIGTNGFDTLTFVPQSPTEILDNIDAEKNASMILTSIGGALKAMSTVGTTINNNNVNNTAYWYNLFENSFNSGVLRKNTLFPHNSINGYIYFPLGANFQNSFNENKYYNIKDFNFKIILNLNNKEKVIELSPVSIW